MTEKFQEYQNLAHTKLKTTDHLFTQSYPLLKEPKLLLVSIKNLHKIQIHIINSLLEYEKLFKRAKTSSIKQEQIEEFKRIATRHKLTEYVNLVKNTQKILTAHVDAPVEFSKNESIIICDREFNVTRITETLVCEILEKTKKMFESIFAISAKNEKIFQN